MTAPVTRPGPSTPFGVCFDLFLRSQATRARVASLLAIGALGIVIGIAIGSSDTADLTEAGAGFIVGYGLALLVPVTSLVFASAVFGDLRDDGAMVYLWLRPLSPWLVSLSAYAATLAVVLPVVTVPLAIAASFTGGGSGLVGATVISCGLGVAVYVALFLALGLRVPRSLVWGLAYIMVWEGIIAQVGSTPARLGVRTYTQSVLIEVTGIDVDAHLVAAPWMVLVPVAVIVGALGYTSLRFRRQDVA
jgi:ABC-2 type transport system permease protein